MQARRTGDLVALRCSPATATSRVRRVSRPMAWWTMLHIRVTLAEGEPPRGAAIRRHRIVERFLADLLGYRWDEADALSVTFEHHLPQERLFARLTDLPPVRSFHTVRRCR